MSEINRPLNDRERNFLIEDLATHVIADQTGCTTDEALKVLERIAAEGRLEIIGDTEEVRVVANGNLLVRAKRDWLAFHADYPGNDPLKDERRADK